MIDIPGVSVAAGVGLSIDTEPSSHHITRQDARIQRYTPRIIRTPLGINVAASGFSATPISDSPDSGRRLELRRIHIDLAQPIAANGTPITEPTTLTLFIVVDAGNMLTDPSKLNSASVIARYSALPVDDKWGRQEVVSVHPENLALIVLNNAGSAVVLSGNVQFTDYPLDEFTDPQLAYSNPEKFDRDRL